MDATAVMLARIQFAVTIGFHFLFPPITLGLSFIIVVMEWLHLKNNDEEYMKISQFLVRILAVIFVLGTATGITMEFAFGNNWSEYSRMVGDIFGAPLAAEGVFAFFLESMFLAVLLFGRNKVSKRAYFWSAFMVFFGSHLSGLWIIIANSWMQTPMGYEIQGGKAVLTNFFQAALNHTTIARYSHVITSGWLTGSLMTAGIGAWMLLKNRETNYAKKMVRVSIIIFIIMSFLQFPLGHISAVKVFHYQPAKMAAFEGLWDSKTQAPLSLFGIPDEKNEKTHFEIGIPGLLSFLTTGDTASRVKGLKEFKKEDRPPVFLVFTVYHIMIALGSLFALIATIGIYLVATGKLCETKWFLYALLYSIPLPHIAIQTGWAAAEVGRQPWAVYGILRTAKAVSIVVPTWQIGLTLALFTLIYTILGILGLKFILKIVREGIARES